MKYCFYLFVLLSGSFSFANTGTQLPVGSPSSILEDIVKQHSRPPSVYLFQSSTSEKIPVIIEDFYYKDGIISLSGKVQDTDSSLVMLKGDTKELYGWVVLRAQNRAYEYTTNTAGMVIVEEVPVSTVFCVDDFEPLHQYPEPAGKIPAFLQQSSIPGAPHIGAYPAGTNVNKLQSLPGASKVIYMNITDMMNGDTPKTQPLADVWLTWAIVAGAYSAYKINVTTDADVYKAAGVPNGCILKYLDREGRSSSGVKTFGTTTAATVYRIRGAGHDPGPYCAGRTGWHESGHVMGTMDYGTKSPATTYFTGIPEFKWVPIMGNFWYSDPWNDDQLQQWCKGEYTNANVTTDMLETVAKIVPYRDDDIPQTKPLKISQSGKVDPNENYGQICPTGDSDGFTFEIIDNKGHAKLKVERSEWIKASGTVKGLGGTMLDIDASILDASGKVIVQHNPIALRYAEFDIDLPQGKYTLMIKGGAEGTPQNGFSNYGSLGFYGITGDITSGATGKTSVEIIRNVLDMCSIRNNSTLSLSIPGKYSFERISVFSANGTTIFTTQKRVQTIDLSHVVSGVYVLNVCVDGASISKKFLKQ